VVLVPADDLKAVRSLRVRWNDLNTLRYLVDGRVTQLSVPLRLTVVLMDGDAMDRRKPANVRATRFLEANGLGQGGVPYPGDVVFAGPAFSGGWESCPVWVEAELTGFSIQR
jgi:hypothetical protein